MGIAFFFGKSLQFIAGGEKDYKKSNLKPTFPSEKKLLNPGRPGRNLLIEAKKEKAKHLHLNLMGPPPSSGEKITVSQSKGRNG